jgi:peptide/nickel transport system permease protein
VGGGVIIIPLFLVALFAPFLTTIDPLEMDFAALLSPPGQGHLLGTDQFGRDIFARIIYGARISFAVGMISVGLALVFGIPIGAVAGYIGGWIDNFLMRVMDAILAFPATLLAIGLVSALGPSTSSAMMAIGVVYIPRFARLMRASVLSKREEEYVVAAKALGERDWRLFFRHIFPNSLSPLIVQSTVTFAFAIIIEAGLSFLGLGTPPPTPSWGLMLNEARAFMTTAPHVAIFPGLAISLAVLGFNLLGDGLRDLLDPRLSSASKSSLA